MCSGCSYGGYRWVCCVATHRIPCHVAIIVVCYVQLTTLGCVTGYHRGSHALQCWSSWSPVSLVAQGL
jgi:hypothetical protein